MLNVNGKEIEGNYTGYSSIVEVSKSVSCCGLLKSPKYSLQPN